MKKVRNIQKATSNFILIVWKIYQFVRNWTEHSVPFAQGKYIDYFNNYDRISTNEPVLLYNLIILRVLSKNIKKDEEFAEGNS